MLKRAVFLSSVLGAVSAACALAFVPELSRVSRVLSTRAATARRGFTPVPPSLADRIHRSTWSLSSPTDADSLAVKYCRFPPPGEAHGGDAADSLQALPDSVDGLPVQGQSTVPRSATSGEAICTGTSSATGTAFRPTVP